METKVLWFERQGDHVDVASTPLLQLDGIDLALVHVRTVEETRAAVLEDGFGCAVVLHEHSSAIWHEVLEVLSSAREHVPVVLLLETDSEELRRSALLAGAWHAVPRDQLSLCAAALKRSLQHAAAIQECARANEALRNAEDVLHKSQRSMALGVLLGSVAHEINNPLEGIANLLYLAKRSKADPETLQVCLDMSEAELNRVSEITKQMLSFHRYSPATQDVNVAELLDGVLTLLNAKFGERHITLHRQYDSSGWMMAYAGELRQAFVNLIANAVDAMEQGGHLTVRVRERGDPHLICAFPSPTQEVACLVR